MRYSHLVQKYIEKLYDGVCTIIEYEQQEGVINNTIEVVKQKNVSCRLSYESVKNVERTEKASNDNQIIKLFLSPNVDIKEGSKVIVTQEKETNSYICAGKPLVYGSHKEIVLELEKRYA